MNDDDLNKRLREAAEMFSLTCCDEAAERIEQLAGDYAGACNEAADCYIKQCAAEAKLAKAVEALQFYAKEEWPQNYPCGVLYAAGNDTSEFKTHLDYGDKARAVLAELEKTE